MKKFLLKHELHVKVARIVVLPFIILFTFCTNSIKQSESDIKELPAPIHQPAWLDDIPLAIAGGFTAEPPIQRRWGDLTIDYIDQYKRRMSEETVIKLKEMGITLVINDYFAGYGIEGEGAYMESAKKFAELCHKHGLRVGAYISNLISYDNFLLEKPEAEGWLVPDYLGKPRSSSRTERRIPYIGHAGYQEYIKKVLKKAILEAKVDYIHFDNSLSYGSHANFHHPHAIEQFRNFLRDKYTPDQLEDRFSLRDVKYVMPPKSHRGFPQPLRDPLFQEFTDFRCWKVSEYLREMSQYIKKLNPEVVVESNPMGDSGENWELSSGRDLARMLPYTEAFFHENEKDPCVMKNGSLVSRIRSLKIGQILDNKLLYHTGHNKQLMAESMAYNQNCIGYIGALLSPYYWDEDAIRYIRFFHDHFQYYIHAKNIAPVAVLRTFPSMAYSDNNTRYSTYLYEQTLIQRKIPFDIIFDQHLKEGLPKYKVLIIANQECMTDEQTELVRAYVVAGGGLVITGKSSLYNDWRRRRNRLGLRDLFPEDLPYPPGTNLRQFENRVGELFTGLFGSPWYSHSSLISELEGFTENKADQVIKGEYGEGRVVYIPHIKPGLNKPPKAAPTSQYWKLPENYEELEDAVRWAAGEPVPIEVQAPLHVTMEWTQQPKSDRMMVHLMNYDIQNHPIVENIGVRIKLPKGKQVKDINIFSPDIEINRNKGSLFFSRINDGVLPYQTNNGWINFSVPNLHVYDMVAVQYE